MTNKKDGESFQEIYKLYEEQVKESCLDTFIYNHQKKKIDALEVELLNHRNNFVKIENIGIKGQIKEALALLNSINLDRTNVSHTLKKVIYILEGSDTRKTPIK
jgi:hypothetical protein